MPLPTKVAAGSGEAAINIGVNVPNNFSFLIYNIGLAVSPTLLGIALFLPRLWDAVIDPVMGSVSDNAKTRWGRRRPFMLVGGLLSIVGMFVICYVPGGIKETDWGQREWGPQLPLGFVTLDLYQPLGDWFYCAYLTLVCILFYTALTIFAVPYGALTMELTSNYSERTRVMSFRTLFTYLSGLLMAWIYPLARQSQDPVQGALVVGVVLAVVILVVTMVPTLFVREPKRVIAAPPTPGSDRPGPEKIGLVRGIKETLAVPAFLMILAAYTVGFLGVIMVIKLGKYVNFYHVYGGGEEGLDKGAFVQGWAETLATLCGIAAAFMINRLARRVEKKWILIGALSCSFVGGLLSWMLYSPGFSTWEKSLPLFGQFGEGTWAGWLPNQITFAFHPLILSFALIWPGLAGLLIMSNSMIADLCDVDELKTGQRREGMYWAVFNWIQKTAIGIALLFSGVILDIVGYDADAEIQSDSAIFNMRLAYLLVVCGGVAVAALITAFIPITQKRMEAVRAELEARRTTSPGA
ncbi:MAG: MFS transporter [Planctomycetota bacterium]